MEVIIAAKNHAKLNMFRQALAYFDLNCVGLNEAGLTNLKVTENGSTPEENALLKARAAWAPGRIVCRQCGY